MQKLKLLFLCTGNSCRSQMAEGWTKTLKSDLIESYSAGIDAHGLNPNAVKVMAESGVDISSQSSKHVDELKNIDFDYVITVCAHAHENCPVFQGNAKVIHVGFDDPPLLARKLEANGVNEETQIREYRRVRDEIKKYIESLPESLNCHNSQSVENKL